MELENLCVDDTQGYDGMRYYDGYTPTLRSERSGLKVIHLPTALKTQRTQEMKENRKKGIPERFADREYVLREDEICNTLTTVQKDNYIAVTGAAMRGRYNENGGTEQQIEIRNDEISNALTTVQKDNLVIIEEKKNE